MPQQNNMRVVICDGREEQERWASVIRNGDERMNSHTIGGSLRTVRAAVRFIPK